jgi:hypothetical protein
LEPHQLRCTEHVRVDHCRMLILHFRIDVTCPERTLFCRPTLGPSVVRSQVILRNDDAVCAFNYDDPFWRARSRALFHNHGPLVCWRHPSCATSKQIGEALPGNAVDGRDFDARKEKRHE